nr:hypothetical protein [Tanacetum cinerariifolium]
GGFERVMVAVMVELLCMRVMMRVRVVAVVMVLLWCRWWRGGEDSGGGLWWSGVEWCSVGDGVGGGVVLIMATGDGWGRREEWRVIYGIG